MNNFADNVFHRMFGKWLCRQGMHSDNDLVFIEENGDCEVHCTRCGYVSIAPAKSPNVIYWGYDSDPEYQKGYTNE